MADNFRVAQTQTFQLAGAGVAQGDSTMTLTSFYQIDGITPLTMFDFGSIGYGTVEPASGVNEEQIQFTGVTNNGNGTFTLTGISHVDDVYPNAATANFSQGHTGGTNFVISNTSGFYQNFPAKRNDETITGIWLVPTPTVSTQIANKQYVDDIAITGAPAATVSLPGLSVVATDNDIDTGNDTYSYLGNPYSLFVLPSQLQTVSENLKFGGTGANGALTIASGTTTINLGNARVFVRNYTSISITGTGALNFSNPNTNGTIIIFKCTGNVTITSSATPAIDLKNLGGQATNNFAGTLYGGTGFIFNPQGGFITPPDILQGALSFTQTDGSHARGVNNYGSSYSKVPPVFAGGGGMGGTGIGNDNGTPGKGAGGMYIECGGSLNFTGSVDASGSNGGASAGSHGNGTQSHPCGGAGYTNSFDYANIGSGNTTAYAVGSGGGGGSFIVLANTITANSGTANVAGGLDGAGSASGGTGLSVIGVNTEFS